MFRIVLGFLAAGALSFAASAKDAKIGGVSLNLPAPPGYCELDRAQASDAKGITFIESLVGRHGNRLIEMSAECEQLKEWRSDKRKVLDNYSQYQTIIAYENNAIPARPDDIVRSTCAAMRERGETIAARIQAEAKALTNLVDNLKLEEARSLGVLDEEAGVCYAGVLQKLSSDATKGKTLLGVYATLFVRGKLVFYYLYAPYVSADTVTDLLAQQKANVVRLKAANKN